MSRTAPMPYLSELNLVIPCSVRNRSTTTGLSQYLARQVCVGETPKAKAVSISINGSITFEFFLTRVFYRKPFGKSVKSHLIHAYGRL